MKNLDKKLIEKIIIVAAPIFTLIMYLLPWVCIYKEQYIWREVISESTPLYRNYFSVLGAEGLTFAKVIMWISLVAIIVVTTLYGISFLIKEKEKQLLKIGSIILVSSTGILVLTVFEKLFTTSTVMGGEFSNWIDFMTLPYALLLVYNVGTLIYICKKMK